MSEESKYYTPNISEFHVGFEYQIYEDFDVNPTQEWHKQVYGRNGADAERIDHISEFSIKNNKVRVKYLDREDIESLGWKKVFNGDSLNIFRIGDNFLTSLKVIETKFLLHTGSYEDGQTNVELKKVLFEGTIKNKSELQILMKQIGILG